MQQSKIRGHHLLDVEAGKKRMDDTMQPPGQLASDYLAELLGIGVADCLVKVRNNAPQKLMQNSAQQIANVSEVFEVRGRVPAGNILLVDDVSDSRWTMTVLGELLRGAANGPVHPFAVAKTKG